MPAPRIEPLALALLVSACAANPPEPAVPASATPVSAEASLDQLAPPPADAPVRQLEELETSLAAYEAQLARNEDRLRAMGVRIAAVAPTEAEDDGDRFAAPPPPRLAEPSPSRDDVDAEKAKPAKKTATKPAETKPAPSPNQPRSPSAGATGDSARSRVVDKKHKDEAAVEVQNNGRCVDLCDLASSTCELEGKICDLAARHVDEPRYGEVCRRAEDDCRLASEACTRCSQ